jgi:prolyl oligopeptidase
MTHRKLKIAVALVCCLACIHAAHAQAPAEDKYLWLEDVSSDRSMAWVNAEDAKTAAVLQKDPRYQPNFDAALKLSEDPRRLAFPGLRGDEVYNNWRDASNPRGLLRKTTVADYLTESPHWTAVIDYDALGKAEKTGWVPRGLTCLYPGTSVCMVQLSAGGEDAVTVREFNLQTGKFVDGGFQLPHSKQSVAWVDGDTLLVQRDWGAGTMTNSGYPFVVKEWKRGTPLDKATEVFRGAATDEVGSSGAVLHDAQGDSLELFSRGVTFFTTQTFVKTPAGVKQLAIPAKSNLAGLLMGRVLVSLDEDWTPAAGGRTYTAGSLVELKLADVLKDPAHLRPAVIFAPTAQEFLQSMALTRDRVLITTLNHVQGRAYVYTPGASGWTHERLPVPDNVAVGIATASDTDNRFFLLIDSFLQPPSLWLGDAGKATLTMAKSEPARFDASNETVEQYEATSKDGTKVPYFVVHPKGMKLDGSNATLLNAYGGFQISMTPGYSATLGKLWLEKGGVYVLANIRGGGEFGPAWHEAGLNVHRQRIYDDFAAVGEDLIARKITSPPHLGIEGGSNGGLLMGVEMEQHPELWNAVVISVPLLDMIRFVHIAAGASWVGEYGSPDVPAQRAFLETISPYQNLKPGVTYPEPLIFTTTKDDRVGPQHARKFAAKMEEFHEPFYFYEITEGGHGSGADLKQQAGTSALTYTYLERKLMP